MGTRSLIHFKENGVHLVTVYQQFDGYPDGVGKRLIEFLDKITIINGIGGGQETPEKYANGMNCLAAQFIAKYKTRVGGLYIFPKAATKQNYDYTVDYVNGEIQLTIKEYTKRLFKGNIKEAVKYLDEYIA